MYMKHGQDVRQKSTTKDSRDKLIHEHVTYVPLNIGLDIVITGSS